MNEDISQIVKHLNALGYLTKEEILILTDERYVKRDEFATLRGKVEAIQVMQSKSSDLLEDIHSTTTKIREENAIQTAKQNQIEKDIKDIKKNAMDRLWNSDKPSGYFFRFTVSLLTIFLVLFFYSSTFGRDIMDDFMAKNGIGVAILSTVSSAAFSWLKK